MGTVKIVLEMTSGISKHHSFKTQIYIEVMLRKIQCLVPPLLWWKIIKRGYVFFWDVELLWQRTAVWYVRSFFSFLTFKFFWKKIHLQNFHFGCGWDCLPLLFRRTSYVWCWSPVWSVFKKYWKKISTFFRLNNRK